ncbi:MAG TPA: DNA-processing protein DprA [Synergistaceae bacterium]|nr:DNA-processing protein DprA [Synergistaceae bacterium]HQF91278.1 DNA-processing protein DprA [Synergistaceae bacterium]HQH78069.1 DNA-processing protein DprA [Synergistaceae bacterium]HQK24645.1 DNA-processing protein DprA [Synergistaceae bacterium]
MDGMAEGALFLLTLGAAGATNARIWQELSSRGSSWQELVEPGSDALWTALGVPPGTVRRFRGLAEGCFAEKEAERAAFQGVHLVTAADPSYPPALWDLADPPPALYVRGKWPLDSGGVAVVGTRRCTSYAFQVAQEVGRRVARAGRWLISGGAMGVDGGAHGGALESGGPTAAVFGTGVDVFFPAEHGDLFRRIVAQGGTLLSEFPLGTTGRPWQFPQRNRIIAALASRTVVVEAPGRSGALVTARRAMEMGRELWVVPGRIDENVCEGSNALLADGGFPLVDVAHFAETLGGQPLQGTLGLYGDEKYDLPSDLGDLERKILAQLRDRGDQTIDNLATGGTMSSAHISSALALLNVRGLVYPSGPGRWRASLKK